MSARYDTECFSCKTHLDINKRVLVRSGSNENAYHGGCSPFIPAHGNDTAQASLSFKFIRPNNYCRELEKSDN